MISDFESQAARSLDLSLIVTATKYSILALNSYPVLENGFIVQFLEKYDLN
jgi:hypothetical protein